MNNSAENKFHEVSRRGLMLVLSSPSGAGKTTISRQLFERDDNLVVSVSVTTRPPRPGEENGRDYIFIDQNIFDHMAGTCELLEHAMVFDNCYGTPKKPVEDTLNAGRDMLFDVDWQGAQQLSHNAREDLVSVFILPPSHQELERRLLSRAQDTKEVVQKRMAKAASEMSHWDAYDYIVVNHDIDKSVAQVEAILAAERLRRERQTGLPDFVAGLCRGDY